MTNLTVLPDRFTRPPSFDLAAHWANSTVQLARKERFTAVLALPTARAAEFGVWGTLDPLPNPTPRLRIPNGWNCFLT